MPDRMPPRAGARIETVDKAEIQEYGIRCPSETIRLSLTCFVGKDLKAWELQQRMHDP